MRFPRRALAITAALTVGAMTAAGCGSSTAGSDTSSSSQSSTAGGGAGSSSAAGSTAAPAAGGSAAAGAGAEADNYNPDHKKLSGEITFQTWSLKNDKFTPYFEKLVSDFQNENPGTKINWIDQPGDGYPQKIVSQIKSDSLPDVVNLPNDIAYQAAKIGALADVSKTVPNLETIYVKGAVDAYKYQGVDGSFGLPWYLGTDVNYWNTDVLKEAGLSKPPASLGEMFDGAKKLHDATGGKKFLISAKPGFISLVAAGVKLMNDDQSKFTFNTPDAAKVIDTYTEAFKSGYLPNDVLSASYQGNSTLFKQGVVGWTTSTGYFIEAMKTDAPTLGGKVVGSKAFGVPPLYVQGVSVSAKSKNPDLATAFARFMTDNKNQLAFVGIAKGFLPGTQAGNTDPAVVKSDGSPQGDAGAIAADEMKTAQNITPVQWTSDMQTYLDQQIALAMTGKQTGQQALDNAVNKANSLLED